LEKIIKISESLRKNLELHANEQNPYEACAILLGTKDEKIWEYISQACQGSTTNHPA